MTSLVASAVLAQTAASIRGRVVDQDGRAISGAQVSLAPNSRRVVSDENGQFGFADVAPGKLTLTVRRIGYQSNSVSIVVADSLATATITLVAIPRQLDSVRIRERNSGFRYSAVVLDQDDRPVAGAEVVAFGMTNKVVTDSLGRFILPKPTRGTLVVRVRKIGYGASTTSIRMLADRADTMRMTRLAQSLSPVEVRERSGYGSDERVYRDTDQRQRWKGAMAGTISREELDALGKLDLCQVLRFAPTGNKYGMHCWGGNEHILVDGAVCQHKPLSAFHADQVETIEYWPPKSDLSGNLAARNCPAPAFVVWLRKGVDRVP